MKRVKSILLGIGGLVGGAAFILGNSAITGAVIAATSYLGYWSYPTFFGVNVMLAAIVFLVIYPAGKPKVKLPRWLSWLDRFLEVDEKKLDKGIWPWVKRRGPFFLVLVCSFFPGPFFAALLIRFVLRLPDQQAWSYSVLANLISTIVTISFYLGVIDAIKSFLASVFTV